MAWWTAFKEALILALKSWRLGLLQLVGNAAIFLVLVWWLHTSEAHWWQLALQFLQICSMAVALLVLHGGTLNYFRNAHEDKAARIAPALSSALRHLLALAVWVFVVHVFEHLISEVGFYRQTVPGYVRSEFPAWLRRSISEPRMDNLYGDLVWLLRWIIAPGLLLPFALFAAGKGFRGLIAFRDWRHTITQRVYWITLMLASVIGVYCASEIMGWKMNPETATLKREQVSFALRLLFAGLLGIFAWLLTCSVLGRSTASGQSGAQPH
jgi:hypothetical protein